MTAECKVTFFGGGGQVAFEGVEGRRDELVKLYADAFANKKVDTFVIKGLGNASAVLNKANVFAVQVEQT